MSIEERFNQLADQWEQETGYSSTIRQAMKHPAYQEIRAMGAAVVPLIISRLKRKGGHWFSLLRELTGANPIRPSHEGRVREMARDWLDWWRTQQAHSERG